MSKTTSITPDPVVVDEFEKLVKDITLKAVIWFQKESLFLKSNLSESLEKSPALHLLRKDLKNYMAMHDLLGIEDKTAALQVMNPNSGDWIKALQITMAEVGVKSYFGPKIRSKNVFEGVGSKDNLRKYVVHRLSFLRALFHILEVSSVILYRGMSTEWDWRPDVNKDRRFWSSWTFRQKVGMDFTDLDCGSKSKNSYILKRSIPIEKLFMTFLETDEMNQQYLEDEAIVLHSIEDRLLW